ncbi:MAG: ATP-binding protein [Lentimicrobiaceae bacterium]|nr:ATP-binding protein [Lentimicrobiaceae bacterium]
MPQYIYIVLFIVFLTLSVVMIFLYYKTKKYQRVLLNKQESEINKFKQQFQRFNQELENRVTERTRQLEEVVNKSKKLEVELKKALKRTEDANYLKNAFLSNMSHEIRTPLNGIIGFASLLESELSINENVELFDYANGISQSGERLLHLLNNIIDISRIEANDMDVSLKPYNINDILKDVAELFIFKSNEKGLKFNLQTQEIPLAITDNNSISKIFTDIIDNSLKYTEKGYINVSTNYNEQTNEICIKIKDTGIGIDSAYLPNIFDAFRQESLGYSRAYQGAGLGLPLAKRLLELMKGRIEIESVKGLGTTVYVYLNSSIEKTVSEGPPNVVHTYLPAKQDKKVFIVEDDRMNRLVLKKRKKTRIPKLLWLWMERKPWLSFRKITIKVLFLMLCYLISTYLRPGTE